MTGTIQTKNWKLLNSIAEGEYIQIPNDAVEVMCIEYANTYNSFTGVIALSPFKSVAPNSYFRFGGRNGCMTIHLDTSDGNLRISQVGMNAIDGTAFSAPVFVYYR